MKLLKTIILATILFQPISTQAMQSSEANTIYTISDFGQIDIATGSMEDLGLFVESIPIETIAHFGMRCAKNIVKNSVLLFTHPECLFLFVMAAVEQQSQQ